MNEDPQNKVIPWLDRPTSLTNLPPESAAPLPPQPVPEEFPLTVDMGKMPWSKVPIAEISPLVWFKYQKYEDHNYIVYDVSDGNGRVLFSVPEEEVAKFFVTSANLYVQAAMTTQV